MKKFKKFFAVILSLAMVLGMSMTAFAATNNGAINVTGLKAESTKVSIYNVVKLDKDGNAWDVAKWAKDITGAITETTDPYTINVDALADAVKNDTTIVADGNQVKVDGSANFTGLEAGVYLIIAETQVKDSVTTYKPMLAVTYTYGSDGIMAATTANVVAKSANIQVDKTATDTFAGVGTVVPFTITTTFPSFHDESGKDTKGTYTIKDTPTGLKIDSESVSVTVGGTTNVLTKNTDYTLNISDKGVMEINFTENYIGTNNTHAGSTVVVSYSATVTDPEGLQNTAQAIVDTKEVGTDTEKVFEGAITITKYGENSKVLNGAEFSVYPGTEKKTTDPDTGKETTTYEKKEGNISAISFVKVSDGVYRVANNDDKEADITTTVVATSGTVQVKGLDEGAYFFEETKAPTGYSINAAGTGATISGEKATADVSVAGSITDTKLSGLPSTGGIGTTIFTIGGCVIMIAAAALFFANRRRAAK